MKTGSDSMSLSALLLNVGVERIVLIDDEYDSHSDEKTVMAMVNSLFSKALAEEEVVRIEQLGLTELFNIDGELNEREEVESVLSDRWPTLDAGLKRQLSTITGLSSSSEQTNAACGAISSYAMDAGVKFERLSIAQWDERKEAELTPPSDSSCGLTILLFDRRLFYVERDGSTAGRAGDKYVSEVLGSCNELLIPGLFTDEVETKEEEQEATSELVQHGVIASVLGKYRADDSQSFCEGLQLFLAMTSLGEIRRIVWECFSDLQPVDKLFQDELSTSMLAGITRHALKEGESIPSGLQRLLENYHHDSVVKRIREKCSANSRAKLILRLTIPDLDALLYNEEIVANSQQLQHQLEYISGSDLKSGHLPLEIGDVFRLKKKGKNKGRQYIVLAQQCSLAVRDNGKRGNEVFQSFRLVELREVSSVEDSSAARFSESKFTWPASTGEQGKGDVLADFGSVIEIPDIILDLCTLADDRPSNQMQLEQELQIEPNHIIRRSFISEWLRECDDQYSRLCACIKTEDSAELEKAAKELRELVREHCYGTAQSRLKLIEKDGRTEFAIERIARLREPYASNLLSEFARYQSRFASPGQVVPNMDNRKKSS